MQFIVGLEHPPHLCPTSNATVRKQANQTAPNIPALGNKLGVKLVWNGVPMTDHKIYLVVEAAGIEAVRNFVLESGMGQWNTANIAATVPIEEALAVSNRMATIF